MSDFAMNIGHLREVWISTFTKCIWLLKLTRNIKWFIEVLFKVKTCYDWFICFKDDDFVVDVRLREGREKGFAKVEMKALMRIRKSSKIFRYSTRYYPHSHFKEIECMRNNSKSWNFCFYDFKLGTIESRCFSVKHGSSGKNKRFTLLFNYWWWKMDFWFQSKNNNT